VRLVGYLKRKNGYTILFNQILGKYSWSEEGRIMNENEICYFLYLSIDSAA